VDDLLIAFLNARLDEREAKAKAVKKPRWRTDETLDVVMEVTDHYLPDTIADGVMYGDMHEGLAAGVAEHIAANDPAYVLADVAAKREIIEAHPSGRDHPEGPLYCLECGPKWKTGKAPRDWIGYPCDTLRVLALPYADHPDYREEWRL
jgi:hypothetical protein